MHNHPDKHGILGDELFLQVIETEVDAVDATLSSDERDRVIRDVSERLQGEIEEHLAAGDLRPELITVRVHDEAVRAVEENGRSAA